MSQAGPKCSTDHLTRRERKIAWGIAAALVMTIAPLRIVAADQGRQPAPRFEVVSVKPCQEGDLPAPATGARQGGSGPVTVSPGRLSIQCVTAERLIGMAYVLNADPLVNNMPVNGSEERWIKQRRVLSATGDPRTYPDRSGAW